MILRHEISERLSRIILSGLTIASLLVLFEHAAYGAPGGASSEALQWLQKDLSCDDLAQEMKTRYASYGSYSQLPQEKKEELGLVLDVICGARFQKCGFKNCGKLAPPPVKAASGEGARPAVYRSFEEEADAVLNQRIAQAREELRKQIQQAQAEDQAKSRGWVRISLPSLDGPAGMIPEEDAEEDEFPPVQQKPARVLRPSAVQNQRLQDGRRGDAAPAESRTARPRPRSDLRVSLPARPSIDLPDPNGKNGGKYLPPSSPAFHNQNHTVNVPLVLDRKYKNGPPI